MTISSDPLFQPGDRIQGKWNKGVYQIVKFLGQGANGKVFLVSRNGSLFALKIGRNTVDHQSEVNALKQLSKSSGTFRKYLLDVDDYDTEGQVYPFCVIQYIKGVGVTEFLSSRGVEWAYLIGTRMLEKLTELHRNGWIFGDIKQENLIVSGYGEVNLIDFGGMSAKGKSVKQFTELYDRGYWSAGSRVAEESYDLFSFAVLFLTFVDSKGVFSKLPVVLPQNRNVDMLLDMVDNEPACKNVAPFLKKVLKGQITSSKEAYTYWRKLVNDGSFRVPAIAKGADPWIRFMFAATLTVFAATVYWFSQ